MSIYGGSRLLIHRAALRNRTWLPTTPRAKPRFAETPLGASRTYTAPRLSAHTCFCGSKCLHATCHNLTRAQPWWDFRRGREHSESTAVFSIPSLRARPGARRKRDLLCVEKNEDEEDQTSQRDFRETVRTEVETAAVVTTEVVVDDLFRGVVLEPSFPILPFPFFPLPPRLIAGRFPLGCLNSAPRVTVDTDDTAAAFASATSRAFAKSAFHLVSATVASASAISA